MTMTHEIAPLAAYQQEPTSETVPTDVREYMSSILDEKRLTADGFSGNYVEQSGELNNQHFSTGIAMQRRHGAGERELPGDDEAYAYYDEATGRMDLAAIDGVSGEGDGAAASRELAQTMHNANVYFSGQPVNYALPRLKNIVMATQRNLEARKDKDPKFAGATAFVGATLQPLYTRDCAAELTILPVGDCVAFITRGNTTEQLNKEDTAAQQRIDEKPAEEQAAEAKNIADATYLQSALTNYIGVSANGATRQPETKQNITAVLFPGDKLTLVTDGITGDTRSQGMGKAKDKFNNTVELQAILERTDLSSQEKAELILQTANKHDDRTVLVTEIKGQPNVQCNARPAGRIAVRRSVK